MADVMKQRGQTQDATSAFHLSVALEAECTSKPIRMFLLQGVEDLRGELHYPEAVLEACMGCPRVDKVRHAA